MKYRPLLLMVFAGFALLLVAAKPSHQLKTVNEVPKDVPKAIADKLNPAGFAVAGPSGAVGQVWLVKDLAVKPGFKPSLSVKYPLSVGQLVGVLSVEKNAAMTDFRGQELPKGVYTLRYGQQPQDGNHIGTSELADFLLALPAKNDDSPEPLADPDKLSEQSAESAGSTHPAIFSLLPPEKPGEAKLSHNEDRDLWILNATTTGKANDQKVQVPFSIVVVGKSEE